jgi:hypothetical protein
MIRLGGRAAKNAKFLPFIFALHFSLMGLYTTIPNTYAANINTFHFALGSAVAAQPHAIVTSGSANWSGYEATSSQGTFTRVQCSARVPTLTTAGDVSTWCGLGGDPSILPGDINPVLVQAGFDSCLGNSCAGNDPSVQQNFAWWEIADAIVVQPVHFAKNLHAGNNMYFSMESDTRSGPKDTFLLKNLTTKETHKIIINLQGATDNGKPYHINKIGLDGPLHLISDGASVECILERPLNAGDGTLAHLPTFGSEKVQTCDAGTTSKQTKLTPIGSLSNISKIAMFDSSLEDQGRYSARRQQDSTRNVIAVPSNLTGHSRDSFIVRGPTQ